MRTPAGYVYLAQSQEDPTVFKIGCTRGRHPDLRMRELRAKKHPFYPFKVAALVMTNKPFNLENALHWEYMARLYRELFRSEDPDNEGERFVRLSRKLCRESAMRFKGGRYVRIH